MFYFFSTIVIAMSPMGEPIMERSITGPFPSSEVCESYHDSIKIITEQSPMAYIVDAKCRKAKKGKAV
jgi:hypothetical protein